MDDTPQHYLHRKSVFGRDAERLNKRRRVALSDVEWRWAEGYGAGKEGYWLLPRQLKLSDGTYIEFEQLKRG